MSTLLFPTAEDFRVEPGLKGQIMCHRIRGFSLILFFSNNCQYCKDFIPIFKRLPGTVGGCQFGIVNIDTSPACVAMSQQTIAPIKYVPYVILYVDGRPLMTYNGPAKTEEIARFIVEVSQNMRKQQPLPQEKVKQPQEQGIPAYTIGHPVKGGKNDMVCYVNMLDAYKTASAANMPGPGMPLGTGTNEQ